MAPAEQERLGRYRLLRRLAIGGMGEVYLAAQDGPAGFEKVVALKRMLSGLAAEREAVKLFLDEARLVARLSHRGIVQIHELGDEGGVYFLAMEYVQGMSVRSLVERSPGGRVPPALAVEIAVQVAEALAYAHEAVGTGGAPLNVVHRDVSPGNILLSTSGDVKLIDFGVAKSSLQHHRTAHGKVKGKLAYMAPEQSQGRAIDGRVDLFALGVVLCEMLGGRHPFDRGDARTTATAVQLDLPALPSAVDPALAPLDAVLERTLAKRPEERFQDGMALADALRAALPALPPAPARLGKYVAGLDGRGIEEIDRSLQDAGILVPWSRSGHGAPGNDDSTASTSPSSTPIGSALDDEVSTVRESPSEQARRLGGTVAMRVRAPLVPDEAAPPRGARSRWRRIRVLAGLLIVLAAAWAAWIRAR